MAKINSRIAAKLVEEIYNRTLGPGVSYCFLGIALVFYRFHSKEFYFEFQVLAILLVLVSFPRAVLGFLGKTKKIDLNKYLLTVHLLVIASAFLWASILCLAIFAVPVASIEMFVAYTFMAFILSAIPSSLLAATRTQLLFCFCIGFIPNLVYFYKIFHENLGLDYLIVPFIILVNFLYVLSHAKKLREGYFLILEQQDRIQQDLVGAKNIQRSLLPPTTQGFENSTLNILYKPCEELSGDFFEIHQHRDHVLFYIADVTSHGTAAAQVTYLLKGSFKNIIAGLGDSIDISQITKQIASDYVSYKLNYSISLFIASFNVKTGDVQYVTSSFPNPLLISDTGTEILPTLDNPVIDAAHFDPQSHFKKGTTQLGYGMRLFAFTDGAYEFRIMNSKREYGYAKFSKLLAENRTSEWATKVDVQLQKVNGSQIFEDDMTILCLSREAPLQ